MKSDKNRIGFILILCLIFTLGFAARDLEIFPYPLLKPVVDIFAATGAILNVPKDNREIRWKEATHDKSGITRSNPALYQDGYTLFTTSHDDIARLIDMKGNIVHEWHVPYSAAWPDHELVKTPYPIDDSYFFLRDFHLYPNGVLLLMYSFAGATPWGAGLLKVDIDGNIIWKFTEHGYNDLHVGNDGTIYALYHQIRFHGVKEAEQIKTPMLEDTIAVLSREGKLLDSISIIEAFQDTEFANFLPNIPAEEYGDPTHMNSVKVIEREITGIEWAKKGNLVISLRNPDTMAIIDPATKKVVHAAWLPFRKQHDIDVLDNGNFLAFDNRGHIGAGGYSRVVEFLPDTLTPVWSYTGDEENPLETYEWGCQQRLANGNTLIVESEKGRVVEVTEDGQIAWEYYTDLRRDGDIPVISAADRFTAAELPFLSKTKKAE